MEIKKRKEWEKRSKQSRIVDIAEELFNENGYEATTLDLIAKEAGYSKRNLYQYFVDKNDIFNAVTLKALKRLNAKITDICALDVNGLKKTVTIINTFFTFYMNYRKSFENIIFFDITYCHNANSHKFAADLGSFGIQAKTLHDANLDLMLKAIELGVQDGSILSTFTPKQLLLIIWGQNLGIIHSIATRQDTLLSEYDSTPEQVFSNYLKMINNCLQCRITDSPDIKN
ncbi:MAG: TetR/AcrR family transcriptional regulator [Candidatus Cloacimonetes bacterium]|nr:TetR/AcrR family transcriptional regulator [Candidatus Cloacimonadota bacterium]